MGDQMEGWASAWVRDCVGSQAQDRAKVFVGEMGQQRTLLLHS